ncbi:MAG: trypsin-like serine protease [Phycisphaerae bacterium]
MMRLSKGSWLLSLLAMLFCALGIAGQSHGIVVSDDPDLHEVDPTSAFAGVGMISSAGKTTGTLIDPWHVLTAGHCIYNVSSHTFSLDLPEGRLTLPMAEAYKHPSIDLAVVRLASPAPLDGYGLYTARDEAGKVGTTLGYGVSGAGCPEPTQYPKGTLRIGWNRIDTAGTSSLTYTFNSPSSSGSLGREREALPADGDSGGPTMLNVGGEWLIAGVHYAISDMDGDGIAPEYGDRCLDMRVSTYAEWIQNVLDGFVAVPGDANLDGIVDLADFSTLKHNFGLTGALWADADFNADGLVDLADYSILKRNYGLTSETWEAETTVPEPVSMLVLGAGGVCLLAAKRR